MGNSMPGVYSIGFLPVPNSAKICYTKANEEINHKAQNTKKERREGVQESILFFLRVLSLAEIP